MGEIDRAKVARGVAKSSQNAFKGGHRPMLRAIARALGRQCTALAKISKIEEQKWVPNIELEV